MWFVVRMYVGSEWLLAGWEKVTSPAWGTSGQALTGFVTGAIANRKIAEALTRHGLGNLVDVTGLERFIPFHRRRENVISTPEHLRLLLEELGITFGSSAFAVLFVQPLFVNQEEENSSWL